MLTQFNVHAFKSMIDLSVDLGVVNVFIGANGSGKSNFLEAVGILGAAASGRVNDESLKYRGVRPGLPELYKASFKNSQIAQHIRFEAKSIDASYAVSLLNPIRNPTPDWAYKHEKLMSSDENGVSRGPRGSDRLNPRLGLAALKAVTFDEGSPGGTLLDVLRNYSIYAPDTPTLRGLETDPQSREPVGLAGGRLPEGVQALSTVVRTASGGVYYRRAPELEALVPLVEWLHRYGVANTSLLPVSPSVPQQRRAFRFVDRFMIEGRNVLSGYDASEGVLYLLFCTVLALHPHSPKLLAVDNFDQALNPRTARDFTRMFTQWIIDRADHQVLLTTHNPLVLDGLALRDDRVRLFAVDRAKSGATMVNRVILTNAVLDCAENGVPLSQQWVMGHFGGVPAGV